MLYFTDGNFNVQACYVVAGYSCVQGTGTIGLTLNTNIGQINFHLADDANATAAQAMNKLIHACNQDIGFSLYSERNYIRIFDVSSVANGIASAGNQLKITGYMFT